MSISLNGDGIISGVSSITVGAGASVFSPAANTLALGTNDVERFRVTSTGQLQATSASDVRLTLGSSGTAGTNDSNHIRGDGTSLKFMNASGGVTLFENNGTERFRITNDGVTFNGDTAAENALDDYEEGTWTPAISYSTSNGDLSYTVQYGSYVKVGRLCHCYFYVWFSESTASGNVEIAGQPFTLSTTGLYGGTSTNLILRENGTPYILQNNYLLRKTDGSILTAADTGSNTVYVGSFTYLTT